MNKQKLNLLVLEDNPDDAELIVRELGKGGFVLEWKRVETEKTFRKALATKPDIILSDYNLPSIDGMAAIMIHQELTPEIPLIIVSDMISGDLAVECMKAGATDYVHKKRLSRLNLIVNRALNEVEAYNDRKKAEEELQRHRDHLEELVQERTSELRESEEKYRTLTEDVNVGVYRNTVGTKGKFIEMNPALIKMFGYKTREGVLKLNVSDLYQNPEERKNFNRQILENGFVKDYEINLIKKDGSVLIGSVSAVAVKDKNGKVKFFDGIIDDITERKQAEEALRESEERYRCLSEASFESIFISEKGVCLEQNSTAEKMFGYTLSEAIGRKGTEWIAPEDREMVMNNALSGYEERYEATALRKDGSTFPAEIQGKMMHYKWRTVRVTALSDITERKKAEDKLKKYANTQKVLLQEVNHRVKNNLTAILGLLGMEEARTENKAYSEFLNKFKGRISGLSAIHSLLSESGWLSLNLGHLCEQVIKASISCLPNSNLINFNVSLSAILINSNQAHHLTLVINELITNSIKHGQNYKNEIHLDIDLKKDKENVIITYKDTGKGYPQGLIDGNFSNIGVGFELIKGIVTHSLRGELQIYNDNGAVTIIIFKLD